jgi:hypothetical protein
VKKREHENKKPIFKLAGERRGKTSSMIAEQAWCADEDDPRNNRGGTPRVSRS